MTRIGAAQLSSWAVMMATGSMLVAGGAMLLRFTARHPDLLPVHVVATLLYDAPLAFAFAVVAVAIMRRLPRHPIGWLFGLLGAAVAFGLFTNGYAAWDLPGTTWILWIWILLTGPLFFSLAMALLLFPTGRSASRRWVWLGRLLWLYLAATVLVNAAAPWQGRNDLIDAPVHTPLGGLKENPIRIAGPDWLPHASSHVSTLGVLLLLIALASLLPRWRRATGDERQQIKWLGLAGLLFTVEITVGLIQGLTAGFPADDAVAGLVGGAIFTLALAAVPVAIGLGIVRYRLYDIDVLINKAIVYGSLVVFIALVYAGSVAAVSLLVERWASSSTMVALAVTGMVAVAFHPLRTRLRAYADRWVYGQRAAPYELMTRLGQDLGQALATRDVLFRIAETAGQAVRARAAQVTITLPGGEVMTAVWPRGLPPGRSDTVVPVHHEGAVIGEISVTGSGARTGDAGLLRHTAAVSAGALRNLRLLAALAALHASIERHNREITASRHRLISAAETERRRLAGLVAERLGPDLDALHAGLPELERQLSTRPEAAGGQCRRLSGHASRLVEELRELSRGVLPPLLNDHGLAAALRGLLRRTDLPATLDIEPTADGVRFPSPVETTVYLCCQSAIRAATTSGHHTSSAALRLWRDSGALAFSFGHDAEHPWNEELTALRDRVTTLGGTLTATPAGRWSVLTGSIPIELSNGWPEAILVSAG